MKKSMLVAGLCMLCGGAAAAPATDIDWYVAHAGARARVIATCGEDPARLANDPDCLAAQAAETRSPAPGLFTRVTDFVEDLL